MSRDRRKALISVEHSRLSVVRQCELVDISRSSYYYTPSGESEFNLELMGEIDRQFLETPFYGSRQMARHLRRRGYAVGRYTGSSFNAYDGFAGDLSKAANVDAKRAPPGLSVPASRFVN